MHKRLKTLTKMIHMSDLKKPEISINFSNFTPVMFYEFMTEVRQSLNKAGRDDIWESVADRLHDAEDSTAAYKILAQYVKLI